MPPLDAAPAPLRDIPAAPAADAPFARRGDPDRGAPEHRAADLPMDDARAAPATSSSARVRDTADPTGSIWHDGLFHRDAWVSAADGEPPSPGVATIVTRKQWLARRGTLAGCGAPLGLVIEPGERLDDIAADLGSFALIALAFPKFSDGRAFSTARLLREKYGYKGELRAVGNVLSDQIPLMRRVGFDSFEVTHVPTRRALVEGRVAEVTLHYQPVASGEPAAGTRPWLRRSGQGRATDRY